MAVTFFQGIFCLLVSSAVSAHNISKRKAGDGKLYVFSSRKGCVSVVSNANCPVSWKLSPVFAKQYNQSSQTCVQTTSLLKLTGADDKCVDDIKSVFCSQVTPRCFEDGSNDYGDAKKLCEKIHASCPKQLSDKYKQQNVCGTISTGKHSLGSCEFLSSPIKGVCPQPKYKMPSDLLKHYVKLSESFARSFDLLEKTQKQGGSEFFSDSCLSTMKKMSCTPFYCSTDESKLLTDYDEEDCQNMITECFDKNLPSVSGEDAASLQIKNMKETLKKTCKIYPARGAQTEMAPAITAPPVGPTGGSGKAARFGFQVFLVLLFVPFMFSQY